LANAKKGGKSVTKENRKKYLWGWEQSELPYFYGDLGTRFQAIFDYMRQVRVGMPKVPMTRGLGGGIGFLAWVRCFRRDILDKLELVLRRDFRNKEEKETQRLMLEVAFEAGRKFEREYPDFGDTYLG